MGGVDQQESAEVSGNWPNIPSAFPKEATNDALTSRTVRKYASIASTVVSTGLSATSNAKHLALVGVGGLAIGGTAGVGLLVAGGVMTAAGMATSAVSFSSTMDHLEGLSDIELTHKIGRKKHACRCLAHHETGVQDHAMILNTVLPYIIAKKKVKAGKKAAGMVGLSLVTAAHRLGKAVYKGVKGTKGKNRSHYANILARHVVTHDCDLVRSIVTELFSAEDYKAIRQMGSILAGELIAGKMKSV